MCSKQCPSFKDGWLFGYSRIVELNRSGDSDSGGLEKEYKIREKQCAEILISILTWKNKMDGH